MIIFLRNLALFFVVVQDCKERWKNLRSCYTRHLKSLSGTSGSAAKTKRPYYLAEYLHFLQPFTKSRKSKGNISFPPSEISSPEETQEVERDVSDQHEHDPQDSFPQPSNTVVNVPVEDEGFATPISQKIKKFKKATVSLSDLNKTAVEYFQSRQADKEKKTENPDLNFLKSLLSDMNEMNSDQKRRFKIGILNLAGQILNEYTPSQNHTPPLSLNPSPIPQNSCPHGNEGAAAVNFGFPSFQQ